MHVAVVSLDGNSRIAKYATFDTAEAASEHVTAFSGVGVFNWDTTTPISQFKFDNGSFAVVDPFLDLSLSVAKAQARKALAAKRYEVETGGITVNGTPVKTDRETQSILTAARTRALEDGNFSVDWKVSNGVFVTLDAATIIAIANAVADHVQACFSNEKALDVLIAAAADVAAVRAVDLKSGW